MLPDPAYSSGNLPRTPASRTDQAASASRATQSPIPACPRTPPQTESARAAPQYAPPLPVWPSAAAAARSRGLPCERSRPQPACSILASCSAGRQSQRWEFRPRSRKAAPQTCNSIPPEFSSTQCSAAASNPRSCRRNQINTRQMRHPAISVSLYEPPFSPANFPESRYSAIHPENRQCRFEGLRPALQPRKLAQPAHLSLRVAAVLLHHLPHVRILLQNLIHFLHRRPTPRRNPLPSLAVNQIRIRPLFRRHRIDNRFHRPQPLLINLRILRQIRERPHFRQHPHQRFQRPHLPYLLQLVAKIFQSEIVLAQLAFQLARLLQIHRLLDALNQPQHVAHAQNARHHAIRQKRFQRIVLFAHAHELHRRARHLPNRKRRPAACVAIHFRQDDAGNSQPLVKFSRRPHRVLPDHRVGHKQQLRRIQLALQLRKFFHQFIIYMQPPRRIHQHHVAGGHLRFAQRPAHNFQRLVRPRSRPHRHPRSLRHLRQLLARRGTIHVG